MSTGGGWQDQVGGLTEGIKLISTKPGIAQNLVVEKIEMPEEGKKELKERFPVFLKKNLSVNPMKCEYFLPEVVSNLLSEGKATVEVRKSLDKWYGVTYKEDKPFVVAAIQSLKDQGLYQQQLWEE